MNSRLLICLALVFGVAPVLCTSCTHPVRNQNEPAFQQLPAEIAEAFNAKDYAKAQTLAAEATHNNPKFAEAWVGYGMASVRLGQMDRARQAYERALSLYQARHRLHPAEANPVVQQIFLLELLGRSDEAESLLKSAQTSYPDDQQIAMWVLHWTELKRSFENWKVSPKRTKL